MGHFGFNFESMQRTRFHAAFSVNSTTGYNASSPWLGNIALQFNTSINSPSCTSGSSISKSTYFSLFKIRHHSSGEIKSKTPLINDIYLLNVVLVHKHRRMTTLATWEQVAGILNTSIRTIVQPKGIIPNIATRVEPA